MAAKLHELLAVEANLNKASDKMLEEVRVTFEKKPDHFQGQIRKVEYFDAERTVENTADTKPLVTTVDERLGYAMDYFGKYVDAVLQKEVANQQANASIRVDGKDLTGALPAPFLLGMEKKLSDLRAVVLVAPTLNPSIVWHEDPSAGDGVYRSAEGQQLKTEKKVRVDIIVQPTDKHPAQVKEYTEDKNVAKILTTFQSGMWTPKKKADIIARLDKLIMAVKKARMRANEAEVTNATVASELFEYILHG